MSLVRVEGLRKTFSRRRGETVHAVNGVSFEIGRGETLALIGESGSGKSTIGRLMLRLLEADSGTVTLDGVDVMSLGAEELRRARASMQIVFQEPLESLNPRMRIGDIVGEPLRIHEPQLGREDRRSRVLAVLQEVGLNTEHADRYARSMSGGQQQRVGIARALITRPKVIVLDEPTSSLDLSVQAQILQILHQLQVDHGMSYLYISHDLSTVSYIAHRVAVLYLGEIREVGSVEDVVDRPRDPYTRSLLGAYLDPDPTARNADYSVPTGEIPSPTALPDGCYFYGRCPQRVETCREPLPGLRPVVGSSDQEVLCVLEHAPHPSRPVASRSS